MRGPRFAQREKGKVLSVGEADRHWSGPEWHRRAVGGRVDCGDREEANQHPGKQAHVSLIKPLYILTGSDKA